MSNYPSFSQNSGDALDLQKGGPAYVVSTGRSRRPIGVNFLAAANFLVGLLVAVVFVPLLVLFLIEFKNPLVLVPLLMLFFFAATNIIVGVKLAELRPWARTWAICLYALLLIFDVSLLPFRSPTVVSLVWDAIALIGIGYLVRPSVRDAFGHPW
jgi:hypothetical protein